MVLRPISAGDHLLLRRWTRDRQLRRIAGRHVFLGRRWIPSAHDAQFVILMREQGRPIGVCGLFGIDRSEGTAEVGILLGEKDTWGHGYGPEALRILLNHARADLGLHQITLCVHATNTRAIRAYEKVGFILERRLTVGRWLLGQGVEVLIMAATGTGSTTAKEGCS